jgi:hypothetical protein
MREKSNAQKGETMNDAAGTLNMILGWPIAPALMVMIALGWDAVTALGGLSGKRRRRSCMTESRGLRELFGRYVGADAARRAVENGTQMGGHERDVAVGARHSVSIAATLRTGT